MAPPVCLCCSCRDIGACPYSCLAFPCPCSTNCCGCGVPPCGYNPCVYCLRFYVYREFAKRSELRWVSLTGSCNCCAAVSCCGSPGISPACCHSIPVMEWLRPDAQFTLVVSHGNGQDLQYVAKEIVPRLHGLRTPVNIVAYEYPGYSLSPLPTSEGLSLMAADAAYWYVRDELEVPAHQIVLYGISLGTGPAVHIAATQDVGGVILQSPYTSIGSTKVGLDMAKLLCCIDLFQSYRLAPRISVPVQIYHGAIDRVVPPECSKDLAPLFSGLHGDPVFCAGAGHNDLIELLHARRQYLPMLDRFLRQVAVTNRTEVPEQSRLLERKPFPESGAEVDAIE